MTALKTFYLSSVTPASDLRGSQKIPCVTPGVAFSRLLSSRSRVTGQSEYEQRNVFIPIIALLDILRQAVRNLSSIGFVVLLTFAHFLASMLDSRRLIERRLWILWPYREYHRLGSTRASLTQCFAQKTSESDDTHDFCSARSLLWHAETTILRP